MKKIIAFANKYPWIWAVIGSIALWVLLGVVSEKMNFESLVANAFSASFLAIAALGQMMVITTGRGAIDLSIPGNITLAAFLNIIIINGNDAMVVPGVLIILAIGGLIGLLNSMSVVHLKIPPIIATIAMGYILSTVSLLLRGGMGLERLNLPQSLVFIAREKVFGINIMIIVVLILAALLTYLLNKTTFGRALIAMGQNYDAAHFAGVNTKKVEALTYIIGGMLAAFSGLLISVRVGGAFLGMGDSYLLETVGGVIIGGTLISGGKASPIGTVIGCLFLTLILTALQVAGVNLGIQNVVKGLLIFVVIALGTTPLKKLNRA